MRIRQTINCILEPAVKPCAAPEPTRAIAQPWGRRPTNNRRGFTLAGRAAWVLSLLGVVGAAGLEFYPGVAFGADHTSRGERRVLELPTVTVLGDSDLRTLPGSGRRVTSDEIRTQSYDDINRVLRKVPGVYLREEDGQGLFPNISLRGVDGARSAKVTIMEDGVLTAPAPYAAPSAYYSPTAGRMHSIEVLKGSSQVRYGPHTTGGVINYVSTPIPAEPTVYFKQLFGNFEEIRSHLYFGDTIDTNNGRLGFLVEGFFRRNEGFKTRDTAPDFADGDDTGFEKTEPMVKLSWEPDTPTYQRFEAKLGYSDIDADEGYLGLTEADFAADPYRQYTASRFDHFESTHTRSYLRHYIEPTRNLNVTTTAYYNKFHRNWFKLNDVSDDPNATPVTFGASDLALAKALAEGGTHLDVLKGNAGGTWRVRNNNRDYYLYGMESVLNTQIEVGGIEHNVTAGLRANSDKERRFQTDEYFNTNASGVVTGSTLGEAGAGGDREEKVDAYTAFVEDKITLGRLTITPGVRVEHLELSTVDFRSGEALDGSLNLLGGGVGVSFEASDTTTLFGGVNRGYSPPGPRAHLRGDMLDEETSIATELGVRYDSGDGVVIGEAVAFYTAFDDLIVLDNVGGAGGSSGDPISENAGRVDSYGLELSSTYDAGVANGWQVNNPFFLAVTLTQAELKNDVNSTDGESIFAGGFDGAKVPYVPEIQASAGVAVNGQRAGAELVVNYVDSTFSTASNVSTQIDAFGQPDARFGRIDSYVTVDLAAHYDINDNVRLLVGAQNLFDEDYLVSRHPFGPRPGRPFTAYVGLELKR